jgi:geranylgeranyl pyrophosphate synthase
MQGKIPSPDVKPLLKRSDDMIRGCLERAFRKVYPVAKKIVQEHVSDHRSLAAAMRYALHDKSPSDYSFLLLTCYGCSGKRIRHVIDIAAAMHLLQTSTFVIDDILDNGQTRAGKATVVKKFGVSQAIAVGQLLQAIAFSHVSARLRTGRFPNGCDVLALLASLVEDVYVGQYMDIQHTRQFHMPLDVYSQMIELTTGRFLSRVAECGALLAGLDSSTVRELSRFGYHYGMALQMCDDVVDVAKSAASTQKTFASDVKERRARLPALLALRSAKGADRRVLSRQLGGGRKLRYSEVVEVINLMKRCGAIAKSVAALKDHVSKAVAIARRLPETRAKRLLELLALDLLNDLDGA